MATTDRDADTPLDLDEVRAALRNRQDDLDARLAGVGFGKRIGDGTIEAVSRMTDAGVGETLELSQDRVRRALAKLDEGTYGECDRCHVAIAPARLRFAPESVHCVDCARLVG
jgi:DnaK suppressor protein